jgi:hypothetical protein
LNRRNRLYCVCAGKRHPSYRPFCGTSFLGKTRKEVFPEKMVNIAHSHKSTADTCGDNSGGDSRCGDRGGGDNNGVAGRPSQQLVHQPVWESNQSQKAYSDQESNTSDELSLGCLINYTFKTGYK